LKGEKGKGKSAFICGSIISFFSVPLRVLRGEEFVFALFVNKKFLDVLSLRLV